MAPILSLKKDLLGEELGGELALGNVDLAFAFEEVDIDASFDCLAVRGRVEDVADGIAILEWVIGDLALLGSTVVGESDKEFTA